MLLQLALDDAASLSVVAAVAELVDIIEVGTPLLKRFGLSAIATVRELAPGVPVLADTKTVDGGAEEAGMVLGAGASLMTVLQLASASTHDAVDRVAREHDAYVVVDTICGALPDRPGLYPERTAYVGLHTPSDMSKLGASGRDRAGDVSALRDLGYGVVIAGSVGADNIGAIVRAAPDIVVVGRAITQAEDPGRAAQWLSDQLPARGHGWPPALRSPSSPRW